MIISTFDKYKRFDTLDGARGVASIAVMIYHYTQHNGLHWMEGAWVSVDMFFILSGFVIAHSYGAKIIGGMTFIEFTAIRLIRLGPLYFFGLGLGICAAVILIQTNATIQIDGMKIVKAAMLGLFWVPYRNWASWPFGTDVITASVFPLNDPAWSLFFELFVNVVFFLFVSRFRVLSSPWLVTLAFVVFVFCTLVLGQHNPGWGVQNFIYGFPRVIAEFFFGALIYSLSLHKLKIPGGIVIVIATVSLLGFFASQSTMQLLNSLEFIPLSIILLATLQTSGAISSICRTLGNLSYPLYILHFPIYRLCFELLGGKFLDPIIQTLLFGFIAIGTSFLVSIFDVSLRKSLITRFSNRMALRFEDKMS